MKRIGVLTGGGDVPGLNSAIKGIVDAGVDKGYEVIGIRRGWEGLTHVSLEDPGSRARYILPLNRDNTRTIDRTGGTFLHTSRTNPKRMKTVPEHLNAGYFPSQESAGVTTYDLTERVLRNLEKLGIDALVSIGGDDTLSYASVLHHEGVPIVAIPKTMDNDVRNTEYCIGFSTAITRAVEAIQRQRSTIGSHERIGIFRIFGRDAGYTALYTAYVTGIRCGIPEYRFDLEGMLDLLMRDRRENPSNYALVVLSEGCTWTGYEVREYGEPDAYGHRKKANVAEALGAEIRNRKRLEIVISDLTYDLRSGEADFIDKMVAVTFAHMAVESIEKRESGLMAAIDKGLYRMVPIPESQQGPRQVDVGSLYDTEKYRPLYSHKAGKPVFLCFAGAPE
ncbi:MAG: 6-phosphofructokinase [Acidobacteria bacterium]|jgi:6-phosphofructokinase 1|nr:6-phosphofructokinase [Acidobacteriota bacterium]